MKICSTCHQQKPFEDFKKRHDCSDGYAGQCKKCHTLKIYEWQKLNKDKFYDTKRKYYLSEKGKKQKQKEESSYVLSGGRKRTEMRRSSKPISYARKVAKSKNSLKRRGLIKELTGFDVFVLGEAVDLARLREIVLGGKWHVDHIVPVSRGGTSIASNLQVVPGRWNQSKGVKETRFFN